mmetsp:Transcript_2782/g.4977  ORF Transcript_2782/g.4977 Transcript_2782/m.4977 type:complete len:235 (+) Transcript_2782:2127-2831(+)
MLLLLFASKNVTLFLADSLAGVTPPSSCFGGNSFGYFSEFTDTVSSVGTLIGAAELMLTVRPALINDTPSEADFSLCRLLGWYGERSGISGKSGKSLADICVSSVKVASFSSGSFSFIESRGNLAVSVGRDDCMKATPSDWVRRRRLCFRSCLPNVNNVDGPEWSPFTTSVSSIDRIFATPFASCFGIFSFRPFPSFDTDVSYVELVSLVSPVVINDTPSEEDLALGRLLGLTF